MNLGNKYKKKTIPFTEIDITTATEDEIIRSGIRYNVKKDYICYALMSILFILMILPPVLRFVVPKPITEVERDIVYLTLSCSYPTTIDNYNFYTELKNEYRDGYITSSEIKYSYKKLNELKQSENTEIEEQTKEEEPTFYAIERMKEVKAEGFTYKKVDNGYVFNADYNINEGLRAVEQLKNFSYEAVSEQKYLSGIGYYCSTDSKEVKERVYVDTGKKVE